MLDLTPLGWVVVALCAIMVGAAKTGIPGIGILVVPLMALVIQPAEKSVGALLGMLILADIFAVIYHRQNAKWGHVLRLLPPAAAGIVAAYFGLKALEDGEHLNPIIGGNVTTIELPTFRTFRISSIYLCISCIHINLSVIRE